MQIASLSGLNFKVSDPRYKLNIANKHVFSITILHFKWYLIVKTTTYRNTQLICALTQILLFFIFNSIYLSSAKIVVTQIDQKSSIQYVL